MILEKAVDKASGRDDSRTVTVINVRSLSYTGTTWLNLVLGSHEEAFTIGPPKRFLDLAGQGKLGEACRVHGAECEFWNRFADAYDPNENLLLELSRYTGKRVLVINNPTQDAAKALLHHRDIRVREIRLVRDGRPVFMSYLRRHPDVSFIKGLQEWLKPALASMPFDEADPHTLNLRYEDVLAGPQDHLTHIGAFVGLDYAPDAVDYWRYDHHPTAGNAGTISIIRYAQGQDRISHDAAGFYREQFERIKREGASAFRDDRWRQHFSTDNRLLYDILCGSEAERFGYAREAFTLPQIRSIVTELQDAADADPAAQEAFDLLSQRLMAGLNEAQPPAAVQARTQLLLSEAKQIFDACRAYGLRGLSRRGRKAVALAALAAVSACGFAFGVGLFVGWTI